MYQIILKMKILLNIFENDKIFYDLIFENIFYENTRNINICLDVDIFIWIINFIFLTLFELKLISFISFMLIISLSFKGDLYFLLSLFLSSNRILNSDLRTFFSFKLLSIKFYFIWLAFLYYSYFFYSINTMTINIIIIFIFFYLIVINFNS